MHTDASISELVFEGVKFYGLTKLTVGKGLLGERKTLKFSKSLQRKIRRVVQVLLN